MKTWLMRRAVRKPVSAAVTARISSSVCRLPFISISPWPARMSSTALAAAASLCATSTSSYFPISIPCSRATFLTLAAGPTRTGMISPASAASIAPRSDVSSHGCTTIVFAAGTFFASAINRSYFDSARWAVDPVACKFTAVFSITTLWPEVCPDRRQRWRDFRALSTGHRRQRVRLPARCGPDLRLSIHRGRSEPRK